VADKVVRLSPIPVLMIGPHSHIGLSGYHPRRIMVPLDGSPTAEVALGPALHIAALTDADLHVVRVVTLPDNWVNPFAPANPFLGVEDLAAEATAYLNKLPVPADTRRAVLRAGFVSNVSDELVRYCGNTGIELVVITSHTRVGASRLLLGGIADELLRSNAPVLVVKPGEARTSSLFAPVSEKVSA
jgi:nucleotide-binding universal stress UspA family protein